MTGHGGHTRRGAPPSPEAAAEAVEPPRRRMGRAADRPMRGALPADDDGCVRRCCGELSGNSMDSTSVHVHQHWLATGSPYTRHAKPRYGCNMPRAAKRG